VKKNSSAYSKGTPLLRSERAVALVIVLSIIVLLTAVVVGFLARAGSERLSASGYKAAASTRQLIGSVVNLVQAQINEATSQGATYAWASQPGAIRVFENSGNLKTIYRLYSASGLTTSNSGDLASDVPPSNWAGAPAVWTDLNAPEADSSGSLHFPILDPRDPATPAQTVALDGFAVNNAPGATASQSAPMPVRWLYVLQNGEIVAPSATTGSTATIGSSGTGNPIIGRIAFWTDDETCKVNINTAGGDGLVSGSTSNPDYSDIAEKTFWDTPLFYTTDDQNLAQCQPAMGEFQRYPGYPATTALREIFSGLGWSGATQDFYNLLPRYNEGGSEGATVPFSSETSVTAKSDRLYPSVGELLFAPNRTASSFTRQQVETGRFFLTARSRAPEISLFGTPRVSIWPIYDTNDAHRSPTDQLLAFCSTIGNQPYYFSRHDHSSPTTDIGLSGNQTLLGYLDTMTSTPIPGFGGDFGTKYGITGKHQILTEIFDYIRSTNLRDPTVPTADTYAAGTSGASWGAVEGECQVVPSKHTAWGTQGFGNFYRIAEASLLFVGVGSGTSSTPVTAATPVYSGQIPTYTGIDGNGTPPANTRAVQAIFILNFFDPAQGWSPSNPSFTVNVSGLDGLTLDTNKLQMPSNATEYIGRYSGLITRYGSFDGTYGGLGGTMDFRIMVGGRVFGSTALNQFPFYSAILPINVSTSKTTMAVGGGGPVIISVYAGNSTSSSNLIQTYTISFPPVTLPIPGLANQNMRRMGSTTSRAVTINDLQPVTSSSTMDRFDLFKSQALPYRTLIDGVNDVVLSMVPNATWGDARLFAIPSVPSGAFVMHPKTASTVRLADGFCFPEGRLFPSDCASSGLRGSLVTGAGYYSPAMGALGTSASDPANNLPIVPATVTGATISGGVPGDWDNGVAARPDGAYINKPDEGCVFSDNVSLPYYAFPSNVLSVSVPLFSPNRQVPSPVMFGSLPTGVDPTGANPKGWQTLLFRPGPSGHPGAVSPEDHLLLDLFWMPSAEPYPISEPFSTAGKVNMNYAIVPFSYITRNTALRAVLASQKVAAVAKNQASTYKQGITGNARLSLNLSDANGTLRQFKEKFDGGDIFHSASQICDIYLVPSGQSWASDSAAQSSWYGDNYALVGDNAREHPYAQIYPRLTTKSNVFTIHYMVQALKIPSALAQNQWNERSGTVLGESRGSATVERYIDPNDPALVNYDPSTQSLESFYRWRVLESYLFAP
jgi:uncharacterized protein (TIGR02600 family)